MEIRGFVLAGGRSRRFGRDKSRIMIDGRHALDRQIDVVSAVCTGDVTVIGDERRSGTNGVRVVSDRHGHQGPLDGLITAFHHAGDSPLALVLAVDLWNLTAPLLDRLVDVFRSSERTKDIDVAFLRSDAGDQPLAAIWRVQVSLPVLQAAFDAGERSVVRAWSTLRRFPVTVSTKELANINTAEEFEIWQAARASSNDVTSPGDPS